MTPQTTLAGPWPEFVFIPQPRDQDAFKLRLAAAKKANTSGRILAFVESNPGTQATFIAEALGCKYKTTASKISVMEKQNLLISKKSDLYGLNNRPVKQYWAKDVMQ